jgi:hypothetical protein
MTFFGLAAGDQNFYPEIMARHALLDPYGQNAAGRL